MKIELTEFRHAPEGMVRGGPYVLKADVLALLDAKDAMIAALHKHLREVSAVAIPAIDAAMARAVQSADEDGKKALWAQVQFEHESPDQAVQS